MIEERMLRSLHVETMRRSDLGGGHEPHQLFQSSTIAALLDGAYEGDVTFAELATRGDTGIGTLNGLDGEMIALDGEFFRADEHGCVGPVAAGERTPFAVIADFSPAVEAELRSPRDLESLRSDLDRLLPGDGAVAIRIDGEFSSVTARSVPRQEQPYRPLAEVVAAQNVFRLGPSSGSLVGFRFPEWSEGIEVGGYHLHFIDAARERGGHVLDFEMKSGRLLAEACSDLCVELPRGVELASAELSSCTHEAIERIERGGDESGARR
jgi:acetolactate decarboxylase